MFWTFVLHCHKKEFAKAFWFGFFFFFGFLVWKGIAIHNCYMYKFLHLNYKFTSVKSVVFVYNCRQRIGMYIEEMAKVFTLKVTSIFFISLVFFFLDFTYRETTDEFLRKADAFKTHLYAYQAHFEDRHITAVFNRNKLCTNYLPYLIS